MTFYLVVVVLLIHWSIKRQVKEIAALILKIEKSKIHHTLRELGRRAINRSYFGKQSTTEFTQAVKSYMGRYNLLPVKSGMIECHTSDHKTNSRNKYHIKKITDVQQNSVRSSFFSHPPSTTFKISAVKVGVFIAVMSISRIVAFVLLISTYRKVKSGFEAISIMAKSSAAIQVLLAFSWKSYSGAYTTGQEGLNQAEMQTVTTNREAIMEIFDIDNTIIRNELFKNKVCSYVIPRLQNNTLREGHRKICAFALGDQEDITIFQAYYSVLNYLDRIRNQINTSKFSITPRQLIESSETAKHDALAFYVTTAVRMVYNNFRESLENVRYRSNHTANWILFVSTSIVVFGLFVYWRYWIKRRLKQMNQLNNCLLCLNQDLLDNEYITSYFGCHGDKSAINYQQGNNLLEE